MALGRTGVCPCRGATRWAMPAIRRDVRCVMEIAPPIPETGFSSWHRTHTTGGEGTRTAVLQRQVEFLPLPASRYLNRANGCTTLTASPLVVVALTCSM